MAEGDPLVQAPPAKRARLEVSALPVLSREEYLEKLDMVLQPMLKIAAMYNSLVDSIVEDPALMTIPIHDHAIVRGHACFDTCSVVDGRLYRLDTHLERHLSAIESARIPLPFGEGCPRACRERMRTVIAQTVVATGLRDACVRYFTSAGPGNFGVVPRGCTSAFYVVVYENTSLGVYGKPMPQTGIEEFTVSVPLKPQLLAQTKSNNYLLNCLTMMSSQDKGGVAGILLDSDGCIAESAVMNCLFVTQDRRLITPTFDKILAGTTVRNILELAKELVAIGALTAVSQEPIPAATARECTEMMLCAGDATVIPIIRWDGKPVGDGKAGEVYQRIVTLLRKDRLEGTEDQYELVY